MSFLPGLSSVASVPVRTVVHRKRVAQPVSVFISDEAEDDSNNSSSGEDGIDEAIEAAFIDDSLIVPAIKTVQSKNAKTVKLIHRVQRMLGQILRRVLSSDIVTKDVQEESKTTNVEVVRDESDMETKDVKEESKTTIVEVVGEESQPASSLRGRKRKQLLSDSEEEYSENKDVNI